MRDELDNPKETVTANEINKFTYCPYQWYYERLYGTKELRRLYKERNEKYGYIDTSKSHFARGLKFHENFGRYEGLHRLFVCLCFALIALAVILCIVFFTSWAE